MVVLNYSGEEINAKIVYYGPGLSGKTTNLDYMYKKMPAHAKGKMVSMKTRTDRTLFFDFLPLDIGDISGYRTRFLLYTVPGQVYYNATRKLVLKGVDAVVFVADSAPEKMEENIESLRNLEDNLNEHGMSLDTIPWVIQYNKRDLPNAMGVEEMHDQLNLLGVPAYEAVATSGHGIYDTFQGIAGMLYRQLKEKLDSGESIVADPEVTEADATGRGDDVAFAVDAALREVGNQDMAPPRTPMQQPATAPPAQTPATPRQPISKQPPGKARPVRPAAPVGVKGAERPAPGPVQPTKRPAAGRPQAVRPPDTAEPQSWVVPRPPVEGGVEPFPNQETATAIEPEGSFSFQETYEKDDEIPTDVGRTVEFDEPSDPPKPEGHEPPEFITDPMRPARPEPEPVEISPEPEPLTVEEERDDIELTVPVVISRSQVRKSIPVKLILEIQVVDD